MSKRITFAEVCLIALLLFILVALGIPLCARALRQSRIAACASHLEQMWRLQQVYYSSYRVGMIVPEPTGRAYWDRLRQAWSSFDKNLSSEVFGCPVRGDWGPEEIHYLGPSVEWIGRLADGDPLGCDDLSNHSEDGRGGGNVLRKSGEVFELTGSEWERVFTERKCIP